MKALEKKHNYETLRQRLVDLGLKATQQRIVIYETLLNLKNHPTAEEIFACIKPCNPSISLGTVYKTLETFIEFQLINKVSTQNEVNRYDANTEYHNHIYCNNTQEIFDFSDADLNKLLEDFFAKKNIRNFKIQNMNLHIYGEKINPENGVSIE